MLGVIVWSGSCLLAARLGKLVGVRHPDAIVKEEQEKERLTTKQNLKMVKNGIAAERKKKNRSRKFSFDVTMHIGPATD